MFAETLGCHNALSRHELAFGHRRQHVFCGLIRTFFVVRAFEVQFQESFERNDFPPCNEFLLSSRHRDSRHRLVQFGIGHLGGQSSLVYQVVQALFFA